MGCWFCFNAYLEERMARDGIALKPGCLVSAALRQAFEIREKHQDGFSPAPIAKKFEDGSTYELVPVKGAKDDEGAGSITQRPSASCLPILMRGRLIWGCW